MEHFDVIIVGGGLAGLTAAIHLSQENHSVLVVEKKIYPHHKVCGEYISNEIVPYFKKLGIPWGAKGAVQIDTLQISTRNGKSTQTKLPLGGTGISRFAFDNLLYQKAIEYGVVFKFNTVVKIEHQNNVFEVITDINESYTSNITIGAYGKRSALDKELNRDFIRHKSEWLGVKSHYENDSFPENLVALHNFNGGYGGLSKTETGAVNFCYLASYKSFQKEKNIPNFTENVVAENPFLNEFLSNSKPIFKEPLTIAQISFQQKKAVENHILMCGDTAGLIHPLCGNGMAMAIHAAKIASELIHRYLSNAAYNRRQLEIDYENTWNDTFKQRLWMGRQMQSLLLNDKMSNLAIKAAIGSPSILRKLITNTHGKPIVC